MEDYGKVSIIIPAYNAEPYIEQCINSAIEQTYKNIEIIVVSDSASKDKTPELVEKIAKQDDRIVIVRQCGKKLGEARNGGLDIATGKYILFLDADDWLESTCCEQTTQIADEYNSQIVFFDHIREYGRKSIPKFSYRQEKLVNSSQRKEFYLYDMRTITAWGKLYLKDCIGNERFDNDIKESEDSEFNFRIYKKVCRANYIHKPLLHYRVLETSAVHGYDKNKVEKFEYTIELLKNNLLDGNEERARAYYSFLGIAYIVLCQNCIYLKPKIALGEKLKDTRALNMKSYFQDMFANIKSIELPITRKIIPVLGCHNFNLGIMFAIWTKQMIEKTRR